MSSVVRESGDHVETVGEPPLANGDESGSDGEQHHKERTPDAVTDVPQDVDANEDGSNDPCRDAEEEWGVRVLCGEDRKHDGAEQAEAHLCGSWKVANDRDEERRGDGDGRNETSEANSSEHFFNDVPEVPEEEQGDEHPRARRRGSHWPSDETPDFEPSYRRGVEDELREQLDASGVNEHRNDSCADKKRGSRHVDIADFEPAVA